MFANLLSAAGSETTQKLISNGLLPCTTILTSGSESSTTTA
jgi:hypothetical protein